MEYRFEWDKKKDLKNQIKHGLTFGDAALVFYDPMRIETHDKNHSLIEDRWKILGMVGLKLIIVNCTERNGKVRLISARKANKNEEKEYFNGYSEI